MKVKKLNLFRPEALEKLSSPEQLDFLVELVRPKDWVILATFGGLITVGLAWSIFGQIPVELEGKGILIQPDAVIPLNAPINGQIKTLNVKSHQCIRKGRVLATLEPVELKEQLKLQRSKLIQLQAQAEDFANIQEQRIASEQVEIAASRTQLLRQLQTTQSFSPELKTKSINALQQQRINLQQRLKNAQAMAPSLRDSLQKRQELADVGAISQSNLIQAQQEYNRTLETITDAQAQLKQTEATEVEIQQKYTQNLNILGEIQTQLQQLETRHRRLEQEKLESRNNQINQIQEVKRNIDELETQIARNSQIISSFDGCLLEFAVTPGQVINRGDNLGRINVDGQQDTTIVVAYFPSGIQLNSLFDKEVAITPDSISDGEGAVMGKLISASILPVTAQGAATTLGNNEIVSNIVGSRGGKIEARIAMERDLSTYSGYRWTSGKGPKVKLTPGKSVHVKIRLKERAPITFLIPMLEDILDPS
jgi:HlyD family secretion protein